jgi:microfibrillar-associated protein 1
LVQQVVAASSGGMATDNNLDSDAEQQLLMNLGPMPDDSDEIINANDDDTGLDTAATTSVRNAWEVRELLRLLHEYDALQAQYVEAAELQRRRKMTDQERLQEEIAAGRYQKPGQSRRLATSAAAGSDGKQDGAGGGPQRFFHRGAFYMDQDEWDDAKKGNKNDNNNEPNAKQDIRHKAAEYAKTATASDKTIMNARASMPAIMQVKKFGMANQNLKYKGLAKEDTTDRQAPILTITKNKEATTNTSRRPKER